MSELLQAVKGMNDLLPPDSAKWSRVEGAARAAFERHGYAEARTPIVEYTPLFVRSIGDATDFRVLITLESKDEGHVAAASLALVERLPANIVVRTD